ncbi:YqjF family protein [Eisenibacter elegans]|jgi:uncharacterized protein YqjF (DUF2071 family)|uniref:YqjF family protein n=1 Tax=Eisenibacter elegans TaxID=997 RepID=UPI0004072D3E|nr:DUF2071 domain-containing protein [Eisenibacter elegans]
MTPTNTPLTQQPVFLKARWEYLAMANYVIDPKVLIPYLPRHTYLDYWNGQTYVSLVGFMFRDTRVLGLPIPWHRHFEEVNLRFYVVFKHTDGSWRRGVVFVREIVPKYAIAWVANGLYREHYKRMPMGHEIIHQADRLSVTYTWGKKQNPHSFRVEADPRPQPLNPNSEAAFITEHYWGYTRYSEQTTLQYAVEHPTWDVFEVQSYHIQLDTAALYGQVFVPYLEAAPSSVLLAKGSEVKVYKGEKCK